MLGAVLLAAAAVVPAGHAFVCTPVRVWDGDGPVWCEEGPRLRIAGIAAREMDGTCRRGHPCPEASGERARDALVVLLGKDVGRALQGHVMVQGEKMRCVATGRSYGRTVAQCRLADGRDLAEAMVQTGTVLRWQP